MGAMSSSNGDAGGGATPVTPRPPPQVRFLVGIRSFGSWAHDWDSGRWGEGLGWGRGGAWLADFRMDVLRDRGGGWS